MMFQLDVELLPSQQTLSLDSIRPRLHEQVSVPLTLSHRSLHGLLGPQGVPEVKVDTVQIISIPM